MEMRQAELAVWVIGAIIVGAALSHFIDNRNTPLPVESYDRIARLSNQDRQNYGRIYDYEATALCDSTVPNYVGYSSGVDYDFNEPWADYYGRTKGGVFKLDVTCVLYTNGSTEKSNILVNCANHPEWNCTENDTVLKEFNYTEQIVYKRSR